LLAERTEFVDTQTMVLFLWFSCTSSGWNYPPILIFGKGRRLWIHPGLLGRSRHTTLIVPTARNKSSLLPGPWRHEEPSVIALAGLAGSPGFNTGQEEA